MTFCAVTARFGDGRAQVRLATKRPKIWLDPAASLPGFNRNRIRDGLMEAFRLWTNVCDVVADMTENANEADIVVYTTPLDGPGGVIADMEMPARNYRPQRNRIDNGERFDTFIGQRSQQGDAFLDFIRVEGHEFGHALGLPHLDDNGRGNDLMDSMYNPAIWTPSKFEADYMGRWFGLPAVATPAPAPTPQPQPKTIIPIPPGQWQLVKVD